MYRALKNVQACNACKPGHFARVADNWSSLVTLASRTDAKRFTIERSRNIQGITEIGGARSVHHGPSALSQPNLH